MPKLTGLATATSDLRSTYGDQIAGIRLRRAVRGGREVYSLLWNDGSKARSQQLTATNEFEARDSAKDLLDQLTGVKQPTTANVPPSGLVRRTLIAALHTNEAKGLRQETTSSNARALHRVAGFLSERGLLLNADSLLAAIKDTDINKRERRSAVQAARALAEEAQIALVVPKSLDYENPQPIKREIDMRDYYAINKALKEELDQLPDYAAWMFRVVACTGVRANAVFSMEIPRHELTPGPGSSLYYFDSKRSKRNKLVKAETIPTLIYEDESMWNVWKLWNVPDEVKVLQVFDRRPTNEELYRWNLLSSEAQKYLRKRLPHLEGLLTFRMLRHMTVERLFRRLGSEKDYIIAAIVSTSVDQLRKTYSQLYTNKATSVVAEAFDYTIRGSADDVKRALDNL
ncbi:hypothetical protein [Synechococcus sp. UW179A]|uniref:hypothetical protein n=1 Tax=Synechococcus sp. UW179A TaxID=2575510 RepID=UPI000E0F4470|nr:hypothetical protein [Synechococcus sp. UW179A]